MDDKEKTQEIKRPANPNEVRVVFAVNETLCPQGSRDRDTLTILADAACSAVAQQLSATVFGVGFRGMQDVVLEETSLKHEPGTHKHFTATVELPKVQEFRDQADELKKVVYVRIRAIQGDVKLNGTVEVPVDKTETGSQAAQD